MFYKDKNYSVLAQKQTWSIFDYQYKNKGPIAIQVLKKPIIKDSKIKERGVLIVGNETLDDLLKNSGSNFKELWFIICTTLSHRVPINLGSDLQMFSNTEGIDEYLNSPSKNIPYFNISCGLFVDNKFFYPDSKINKEFDVIYVAKWYPTKRIELLIDASRQWRDGIKAMFVSVPIPTKTMSEESIGYKQRIIEDLKKAKNITWIESPDGVFKHDDGTYVPGGFTPCQMRELFNKSKMTILLSDWDEGVNRSICEGICCDLPVVMTRDLVGGSKKVILPETGVFVDPAGKSIANGIEYVLDHYFQFKPRKWFTQNYGMQNSMRLLKNKVREISIFQGSPISVEGWNNYNGGPWTMDYYEKVKKLESLVL